MREGEISSSGPNVTYDGQKIHVPGNVAGILKVTFTETYADIGSNALSVADGAGPYSWQVVEGSSFASFGDAETADVLDVLNISDPGTPSTVRFRVDDSCGEIITLDVTVGMIWSEDNPGTIGANDEVAVSVDGGVGPYSWTVSGTGFSMGTDITDDGVNLLISDGAACGSAEITVTDSCGDTVTGYVRCTASGSWSNTGDVCFDESIGNNTSYGDPIQNIRYGTLAYHGKTQAWAGTCCEYYCNNWQNMNYPSQLYFCGESGYCFSATWNAKVIRIWTEEWVC